MDNFRYPQMKRLETKNCILRPATLEDAKDIYEYYKKDIVVKYLPLNKHKCINDSERFINHFFLNHYNKKEIGHYVIVYKKDNKVIGNVGFNNIKQNAKVGEIGICINPSYWGKNLSTELAQRIIKFGFQEVKLSKIIAITYMNNDYSKKSLYDIGFKFKGVYKKKLKQRYELCYKYELLKSNYYKRRG